MSNPIYLAIDKNAKTIKGQKLGYMTAILYLAPADASGVANVCPHASAGCKAACLYTSGMAGRFPKINQARIKKTLAFLSNRAAFLAQLETDIQILIKKSAKAGMIPAVRLNGTSDLPWENFGLMQKFPQIQFYDYTKNVNRMFRELPANYHLTFSRSEENGADAEKVARAGKNVAVVFDSKNYPSDYYGSPVVNGDDSDLRFLDASGVIVGLYAKGKAKKDKSGFVVSTVTA